jgi:hypothetical protein
VTRSGARLILASTAASCVGFLLCLPRAVPPRELPALVIDPDAAAAALDEDEALAARAPHDEASDRLRALFAEHARSRTLPATPEDRPPTPDALEDLREAAVAVRAAHGEAGLAALRAEAADRAERALGGELDADEERDALGSFPRLAERYGLVRDGRIVAPRFVVRALFEAQWNTIVGLEATAGLDRAEEQAYWGWLALEARDAPVPLRESALDAYAEVGGRGAEEARAILEYLRGHHADAFLRYKALYEATGELRLRNHAVAAQAGIE